MKLNDFFNEPDEVTTDRVSEKYPALSDQHKERLFAMSKRKYDINNNNDISKVSEVSGVEHYSKPKWYKAVSIAAAAVLAVGGLGSGMALIIRNGHAPASSSQVSEDNIETSTVEEKTESTTSEEITMTEDEYKAIGKEITDNYLEISNIIQGCKVSTDENDCISYYVYDSQDTEWTNNYAYYRTFFRVTDERFKNFDDIYNCFKQYKTAGRSTDWYGTDDLYQLEEGYSVKQYYGGDISAYPSGSDIDLAAMREDDDSFIYLDGNYVMYNGSLYTAGNRWETPYFNDEIETKVSDLSAESFTFSRYIINPLYDSNVKYGMEKIYKMVLEDGKWKIDCIDTGAQVEVSASSAIKNYLYDNSDFNEIDVEKLECILTDFDEAKKTCKAHGICKDIIGDDAIEIDAEIDVEAYELINIEVNRLKEVDRSLKRPDVLWRENYLDRMARAVKKYIESSDEYKDMDLDLELDHIYTKVYDYDDSAGTCTGHAMVISKNNDISLDWYVGVDLNSETVTFHQEHSEAFGDEE